MSPDNSFIVPELPKAITGSHLQTLATKLGDYLGVGCDAVAFMLLLSRAGARMGLPIHMVVATDCAGALRLLADRIAALADEPIARAHNVAEFRKHFRAGFPSTELIILHSHNRPLLGHALEESCRAVSVPTLWWIGSGTSLPTLAGPILRMTTSADQHALVGFGHHYCTPPTTSNNLDRVDAAGTLEFVLDALPVEMTFLVPFQRTIRAALAADEMLVLNRLMRVIAALRLDFGEEQHRQCQVQPNDYALARALLAALPITPAQRSLPPEVIRSAMLIWEQVHASGYQRSVADHSPLGFQTFSREQARIWTGLSYNGIKRHLGVLEDEGVIRSAVPDSQRSRGKKIDFAFCLGSLPPFHCPNPFNALPEAAEITAACNTQAQT